ncbi:MAG TPA: hypothetical protein VIL71_04060 [Spirillospora sp.]
MFDGLDDIDWEGRGAPEVPDLLRSIERDDDGAEEAASQLYESLYEYGSPSTAAAALPFLVEAVSDTRLSTRRDLSDTLREIAAMDEWSGPDLRAWTEAAPGLLRLLDDDDAEVVVNILSTLAAAPDEDGRVAAGLRGRWERAAGDGGRPPRVDLALAILRLDEPGPDDSVRRWLTGMLGSPRAEERLAAARAILVVRPDDARAREEMADAVRRGDVFPWRAGQRPWEQEGVLVGEWARACRNQKAERIRRALELLEKRDPDERERGAQDAAHLLATWPSAEEELLPALARHLGDRRAEVRAYALHALAACGERSAPFTDAIAGLTTDTTAAAAYTEVRIGDLAVWALARAGDRRCVPFLRSWLDETGTTGFNEWLSGGGPRHLYHLNMPSLHEVVGTARPFAAELVPAVRARLRSTYDLVRCREMAWILEAWGPDAAAAVPELIELLCTEARFSASRALGEMGPEAAEAASELRSVFEPKRRRSSSSAPESRREGLTAAWAYWRVTGDAETPGPALARGLDDGEEYMALRYLGDMGARAPVSADRVRAFLQGGGDHMRVYAARACSRITGEPEPALGVFTEMLGPIAHAEIVEPLSRVVRYIHEMGPPAARTVPLMEAALALDLRLNTLGGWQAIADDHRDRRALAEAIEAVSG